MLRVLFYSKYSKESLDVIKGVPKVHLFCVDNVEIRQRILKDSHLKIRQVPCLLEISEDGQVSTYYDFSLFENSYEQAEENTTEEIDEEHEDIEDENENQDQDSEENDLGQKSNNGSSSAVAISNMVQQMQREREQDENLLKQQQGKNLN